MLAFMTFPRAHWTQIYSTNPLTAAERRGQAPHDLVGIFPNDGVIVA